MHSLQKQFHDFISLHEMIKRGEKLLLAVSGGVDSMVMAELFLAEKIPFAIAHCNFGLRGEASDGDEKLVMEWAEGHGVDCYVKSFNIEGSVQLAARDARYQWFEELALTNDFDKLATAHHLEDSLETVLINLTRGTGIKGMKGIAISTDRIIRPLMFATKEQIYAYAQAENVHWREDASNAKTEYDRNLIRNQIVPQMKVLNPSLFRTYSLTAERLFYANKIIEQEVVKIKHRFFHSNGDHWELDISWMKDDADVIVLAEILTLFDVNYATTKEIFEARDKSGKTFPCNEWIITVDRAVLFIHRSGRETFMDLVIEKTGTYDIGDSKISAEEVSAEQVDFSPNGDIAYLDADITPFPFRIRSWKEGDRIQPIGMRGSKKVSDLLVDEKVPLPQKRNVLVVESGEQIAWVIGYRLSDHFKITLQTKSVLKITRSQ